MFVFSCLLICCSRFSSFLTVCKQLVSSFKLCG
nr:MAG TPA: hypothetical protein [Caudoviricetes sp.]